MTSFETLLSHLPDRAAALNYTKSLPINEIETILSECTRNTSIDDPRFIYIWQICQITLNKPAISPDGAIKSLLPLAKWHLSYLLGAGGVPAMKHRLQQMFGEKCLDHPTISKLLTMNIAAAKKKGYKVKLQVLTMILTMIEHHFQANDHRNNHTETKVKTPSAPSTSTSKKPLIPSISTDKSTSKSTTPQHAPVFLDLNNTISATNIIDGTSLCVQGCSNLWRPQKKTGNSKKNNRKKTKKKEKKNLATTSKALVSSLDKYGFAAIDEFASADEVIKLRHEIARLAPHTEQSQIWVGKSSGVGAHVTLPKVRGDKVLWMCGGHGKKDQEANLFDSAGVQPKTTGEIEPCDPTVHAATSFDGRFVYLRTLLKRLDQLIYDGLKQTNHERLKGISSRSDCMLAQYKVGDRFQKHVDNTTQDGRKLTCLVYLNISNETSGGHLRLHGCSGLDEGDVVSIQPLGGRLAMFWSDEVSHEVLEQLTGDRWAITCWYYDFGERMRAVMKAQDENVGVEEDVNSTDSQKEAQQFVLTLLDDNNPKQNDEERLLSLKRTATLLSLPSLCILGRVFFGRTVTMNKEKEENDVLTPETIRRSLLSLDVKQYCELRAQARDMHSGK